MPWYGGGAGLGLTRVLRIHWILILFFVVSRDKLRAQHAMRVVCFLRSTDVAQMYPSLRWDDIARIRDDQNPWP